MEENIIGYKENIMDTATEEVSEEYKEKLADLNSARVVTGIDANGTPIVDYRRVRKTRQLVRKHEKIGRNDPCPCGSGKKYKNCCLNTGEYEGLEEI